MTTRRNNQSSSKRKREELDEDFTSHDSTDYKIPQAIVGSRNSDNNNNNNNQGEKKVSLILRISEACETHKEFHIQHPPKQDDYDEEISSKCWNDLKSLRTIIPRLESEHIAPTRSSTICSSSEQNLHPNQCIMTSNSENISAIDNIQKSCSCEDISNLCNFYCMIVNGSFCPHSMKLLMDDGSLGKEIFPRVNQLLRHLTTQLIIHDTCTNLILQSQQQQQQGNMDPAYENENVRGEGSKYMIADRISSTCTLLLYSIPEKDLSSLVLKDLITLLFDLSVIHTSGIMANIEKENDCIDVAIFTSCTATATVNQEFKIDIGTTEELLSLQTGILQLIFSLLTSTHHANVTSTDHYDHYNEGEEPSYYDGFDFLHYFLSDEDLLKACLVSIRQILSYPTPIMASRHGEVSGKNSADYMVLLDLRNKVVAGNLLSLLLPDYSLFASRSDSIGDSSIWIELIFLISNVIKGHFSFISENSKRLTQDNVSSKHTVNAGLEATADMAIQTVIHSLSDIISILLRDIFICPTVTFSDQLQALLALRSKVICILFDCVPFIHHIIFHYHSSIPSNLRILCHDTLLGLYVTFCPCVEDFVNIDNSSSDNEEFHSFNQQLEHVKIMTRQHCSLNNLFQPLFSLMSEPNFMTIVNGIVSELTRNVVSSTWNLNILRSICQNSLLSDFRGTSQNSFESYLTHFIHHAQSDATAIIEMFGDRGRDDESNIPFVTVTIVINITNAILLLENQIMCIPLDTLDRYASVLDTIQYLYRASTSLVQYITSSYTNQPSNDDEARYIEITRIFVIRGFDFISIHRRSSELSRTSIASEREQFCLSISNLFLNSKSEFEFDLDEMDKLHIPMVKEQLSSSYFCNYFTPSTIGMITKEQKLLIMLRRDKSQQFCRQICSKLRSIFGLTTRLEKEKCFRGCCFCGLLHSRKEIIDKSDDSEVFKGYIFTILLDTCLPLRLRKIMLLSLIPNDNSNAGNVSHTCKSTRSYFEEVFDGNGGFDFNDILFHIPCLPILIKSIITKPFSQSLISVPDMLKRFKYQTLFYWIQAENEYRNLLYKMFFESLHELICVYKVGTIFDGLFTPHFHLQGNAENMCEYSGFQEVMIELLKHVNDHIEELRSVSQIRLSLWKFLRSVFTFSDLQCSKSSTWFVETPLRDSDDIVRLLTAMELGQTISHSVPYSANIRDAISELFLNIDEQFRSNTLIYSSCLATSPECELSSIILENGVRILVQQLITKKGETLFFCGEVFEILRTLFEKGVFEANSGEYNYESLVPKLIADFFSANAHPRLPMSHSVHIHQLLALCIKTFIFDKTDVSYNNYILAQIISSFFDKVQILPEVATLLILRKEYDALCLCVYFRSYYRSILKKYQVPNDNLVVGSYDKRRRVQREMLLISMQESVFQLCSSFKNELLNHLLPHLLLHANLGPLVFFLQTVLQSKISLRTLVLKKELAVIKEIVWELGRLDGDLEYDTPNNNNALQGLLRGARILNYSNVHDLVDVDDERSLTSIDALITSEKDSVICIADAWIGKHFMMLLVTVVTERFKRGSVFEKLQSLKCLRALMRFLNGTESPKYFTQVMRVVESAMNFNDDCSYSPFILSQMRLIAVQALSRYVKVLIGCHLKTIGENLSKILVSIFPLLDNSSIISGEYESKLDSFMEKAIEEAISLLSFIMDGKNGEQLATYFKSLPFFPKNRRLDNLRVNLTRLGVDLDDDLNDIDKLSSRLESLIRLLNHENDNVRRVVLNHIIEVVHSNRTTFYRLIDPGKSLLYYLTIIYKQPCESAADTACVTDAVQHLIESILDRCISENNTSNRILLAKCLGEIGAISTAYISDYFSRNNLFDTSKLMLRWVIDHGAPWKSTSTISDYMLQLLTIHLVAALKGAPTPTDHQQIAMAIQEVLKLYNNSFYGDETAKSIHPDLRKNLESNGVLDVIEPFFSTLYKYAKENNTHKQPPFFADAASYFVWLSSFEKFMIVRSYDNPTSRFRSMFYACRSVLKSLSGIVVMEFLFPVLVLDSLCFGSNTDRDVVCSELKSVIECRDIKVSMKKDDVQKTVTAVFMVIDTLQIWAEKEIESNFKSKQKRKSVTEKGNEWPVDESLGRIDDIIKQIPLSSCANAAKSVDMPARSLRFLEMHHREKTSEKTYDDVSVSRSSLKDSNLGNFSNLDVSLMKQLFGELNDFDTMSAIPHNFGDDNINDYIREREAYSDWNAVIVGCEEALQVSRQNGWHERLELSGAHLNASLEIGLLENALNHFNGIMGSLSSSHRSTAFKKILPFAVESSWRLSRWDVLENLVTNTYDWEKHLKTDQDSQCCFRMALGKAILGLHRNSMTIVSDAITQAREAVLSTLSVAARDNYSRAYPSILKLHTLREIEDMGQIICQPDENYLSKLSSGRIFDDLSWGSRMDCTGTDFSNAMQIFNVRLALSRLLSEKTIEAKLWLELGTRARKAGSLRIAATSLGHANVIWKSLLMGQSDPNQSLNSMDMISTNCKEVCLQLAKLKYAEGRTTEGLLMLDQDKIFEIGEEAMVDTLKIYARHALQGIEWMVRGGISSGSDVIARYRKLQKKLPDWERAHFLFAKYIDSVLDSRINTLLGRVEEIKDEDSGRSEVIKGDVGCQKYILEAMKGYGEALRLSEKHVFQALPRMLFLWFDFTAIDSENVTQLEENQMEANKQQYANIKTIPAITYYSALPQLISRVGHVDQDTVKIVIGILIKVLTEFPGQGMWALAWLRESMDSDRRKKGEEIFDIAQKKLRKTGNTRSQDLLESSKHLIRYLIEMAKYDPKPNNAKTFTIRPWKGGVDLSAFIPPLQAALTVSRNGIGSSYTSTREMFPQSFPRMKHFKSQVQIMNSKAKPKKVTAIATAESSSQDIGEMHFLVKQEAKGDLRKDARVQDLNNVINRLFSSSSTEGRGKHRQLNLRTYSVVCLSEDCGILEWVPNTESFRSLITKCYNPQASLSSKRRRGKRLTDFSDINLRGSYLKCQDIYIQKGNLVKATEMFQMFLHDYPPLFYWWFVSEFQDPHQWFEARLKFTLSSATWSAVGHVIGLGDRHSENMLIDCTNGEVCHVDFDCIFDKGLNLPRPEIVPFRLTPNMVDAFGPCGASGAFTGALTVAMSTLRNNRDVLLSVLEPFLKDPVIDWKRQRVTQGRDNSDAATLEAKRSIKVIDGRLKGVYNLKNPNVKKIRRVDGYSVDEHDEMVRLLPLSVEGQVHKMITEACSRENLVQLYVGWMPWL